MTNIARLISYKAYRNLDGEYTKDKNISLAVTIDLVNEGLN